MTEQERAVRETPLPDIKAEARRLLHVADEGSVVVRLLGGVAIALLAHDTLPPPLHRHYGDIDLIVHPRHVRPLSALLEQFGYLPNQRFNNLHSNQRLLFCDHTNGRQLDVFVGVFRMCHTLHLDNRLTLCPTTLPPADLLLTKLQIVQINQKDLIDAVALLYLCETGYAEKCDIVNLTRLIEVTSRDWGWYTTCADNLDRVIPVAGELLDAQDVVLVNRRVEVIKEAIAGAPKTWQWKIRAWIGRRLPWYELPEEVTKG
jgi:hypothetical protein